MTKLSEDSLLQLAKLAKLRLSPEELQTYRQHLSDILHYVEQLDELDLSDVEPTTHAGAPLNTWRPDEVEQRLSAAQILDNAPQTQQEQLCVPKVIGE